MWRRRLNLLTLFTSALVVASHARARGSEFARWVEEAAALADFGCLFCKSAGVVGIAGEVADSVRFEPGTGRDLRNYAPDRPADLLHMRLDFDIPDMNRPELSAKQTLTFTPIARPLDVLTLDARAMEIESVSIPDDSPLHRTTHATYSYDGRKLAIRFDPPIPPGEEAQLVVRYSLHDPPAGLTWTPESPEWPGRAAQIHTQGQPETNRYWFPAHDFPNERLTTEIVATVPEGFIVSANGREAEPPRTVNGRTTFHWLQDKSHVSYLVSMVVGKFDVKDVAPPGSTIPMPVYVPPGRGGDIDRTFGRTAEMMRVFEKRFSQPYPWDRYGQVCVWNFGAGGMENTSVTTLYDTAHLDEKALLDGDLDGLISHELAHQWFGDLITCNTWAHIWLNEGWATYSTGLWYEARDGVQNGYVNYMWRTMRNIARSDQIAPDAKGPALDRPGMVSPIYKHPWETFRRTSNPYPKGASILHMLRMMLGEELFFKGVGEYVSRYKFRTAETSDFRRTLEEVSGRSLEHFFTQWCERPGTPRVNVRAAWSPREKELRLIVEQKQLIDAERPAFAFDLPVEIHPKTGGAVCVVIPVDSVRHERAVPLDAEPAMVLIDPDLHVLMSVEVDQPQAWLVNQMTTQRSIASRLDALNFARGRPNERVRAAVAGVLTDEQEWHAVRAEAAATLGRISALDELLAALDKGVNDARVRRAVLRAIGDIGGESVLPVLARHAGDESESYACRATALEWLGRHAPRGSTEYLPVFAAALKAESQHDQVRIGAIRGLANLDVKDALAMVIPYTKPGTPGRTRPDAISAVQKLSKHDKEAAWGALSPLVFDRESRTRRAAISALVELKDDRGLEPLDRLIDTTKDDELREVVQSARDRLAAALRNRESIDSTNAELERLKADVKRLESRVNSGARRDRPERDEREEP